MVYALRWIWFLGFMSLCNVVIGYLLPGQKTEQLIVGCVAGFMAGCATKPLMPWWDPERKKKVPE